jgi:hypothetical protein
LSFEAQGTGTGTNTNTSSFGLTRKTPVEGDPTIVDSMFKWLLSPQLGESGIRKQWDVFLLAYKLLSYLYLFLLSNCSHLSKEVTFLYPSFGTCSLKLKRVKAPYSTITNNSIVRPRSTLFFYSYSLYFLFMINTITQSYSSAHSRAADHENEERKGRVIVLARPALVNQSQQPNLST